MSKELTKQELVRLSWLTELRRQGDRQCQGSYGAQHGRVCALGLLVVVCGETIDWAEENEIDDVGALAGLTLKQAEEVARLNDGDYSCHSCHKHTFSEIADVVEGWFRKDAA